MASSSAQLARPFARFRVGVLSILCCTTRWAVVRKKQVLRVRHLFRRIGIDVGHQAKQYIDKDSFPLSGCRVAVEQHVGFGSHRGGPNRGQVRTHNAREREGHVGCGGTGWSVK